MPNFFRSQMTAKPKPVASADCSPAQCSAALLEIIKTCEDYQNADVEGVELIQEVNDAYVVMCKVIVIANGMLAKLEAQQNAKVSNEPS